MDDKINIFKMQCLDQLFHNFWIGMFWILRKQKRSKWVAKHLKKYFLPHKLQRYSFCFSATQPELDPSQSLALKVHTHTSVYMIELFSLFRAVPEVGAVLSAGAQAFFCLLRASVFLFCFLFPMSERASTFENPSRKYHFPIRCYHSLIWRNRKGKKNATNNIHKVEK